MHGVKPGGRASHAPKLLRCGAGGQCGSVWVERCGGDTSKQYFKVRSQWSPCTARLSPLCRHLENVTTILFYDSVTRAFLLITNKYPDAEITQVIFHPRLYPKMPGVCSWRRSCFSINQQPPKPSEGHYPALWPLSPQEVTLLWHGHEALSSPRCTPVSWCHLLVIGLEPASPAPKGWW